MLTEEMELFLEDMDDQLTIMELTLLDISEISLDQIDQEMLNKLFRAMHTMKGNAGIFGYDTIVQFAHVAENLLDEVRNGKIQLTQDMIDVLLEVKDHAKVLVEVYTQNNTLDEEQLAFHNSLIEQLSNFLNQKQAVQEVIKKPVEEVEISQDDKSSLTPYKIDIKLKDDFFKSGMDMLSIIKYLGVIGEVKKVEILDQQVPTIDKIEVDKAYINITILYETDEPKSEIVEAFEFVEEDIELDIKLYLEDQDIEKQERLEEQIEEKTLVEDEVNEVKSDEEVIVQEQVENQKEPTNESVPQEFIVFKKPKKQAPKPAQVASTSSTLKVDSLKIDKIINQISEMVIANAKITQYAQGTNDSDFEEAVLVMSDMLEEIRNGIMNIRMIPVGESLSKLRRIVTDASKKMGKEISFDIIGGETELDKTVIEKISDPLVHMLRNSVDHGIELPQIRKQKGKNTKGNITLKAYPDSGSIVIQIIDDGAGINKNILLKKAIEKEIITAKDKLSDDEILHLIFAPGFSTAQEITDISGRGVGMDVVKRNIQELRGTIDIESQEDKGTTFTIRLPLTLAIIDGFLVKSGESKYIIPIDSIQECIELNTSTKKQIEVNGYISLRSNILPVIDIAEHFGEKQVQNIRENIVVVKYGNHTVGLKVDELYGEFQTVIKPLGDLFDNISGISGGTILGDGDIALIFDVQKLIEYKITHKESEHGK